MDIEVIRNLQKWQALSIRMRPAFFSCMSLIQQGDCRKPYRKSYVSSVRYPCTDSVLSSWK